MKFPPDPEYPMSVHQFMEVLLRRHQLPGVTAENAKANQPFRPLDDWTLIYEDEVDSIVVAIRGTVVFIISGGRNARPGWIMREVRTTTGPCFFWEGVLQDVLGCL